MKHSAITRTLGTSILVVLALTVVVSCGANKSAIVYGTKWTGLIRTPLAPIYQAPGNPPYSIKEDLKFAGGFGEIKGDLSKYNFSIDSTYLTVTNDKPGTGETWQDIWKVYSDSGIKSDGSREVFIKGRCFLKSKKLNPVHPKGSLDFDLRLVVVPNKPYHFVMNVKTTKQGTASDLQISGNASPPDGVITLLP